MKEFNVPPYMEAEVNGTYVGVLVNVLEQVLENSGFHLELRELSDGETHYVVVKGGTGK